MVDQLALFEGGQEPPKEVQPALPVLDPRKVPRLTRLRISGLKGFDEAEVVVAPLTVLTGPNNSGKTTILQAVALAFDCLRRSVDFERWELRPNGRAVVEFAFLPVNEPLDLWYKRRWAPSKDKQRAVRVGLDFEDGVKMRLRIRYLFGALNMGLEDDSDRPTGERLKELVSCAPLYLPPSPGPAAHEAYLTDAFVSRQLAQREPDRVLRNLVYRLQDQDEDRRFVDEVLSRYFGCRLDEIKFDPALDLEIRAPISTGIMSHDIVSGGSGFAQMLQLAVAVAWRKPKILLLDEPDAHLHSSVQRNLYDFLDHLVSTSGMQVILATHSRDLISQSPLESIVPVDTSRKVLEPLTSMDHLLLEFKRYGELSNVDLALLYRTRSCLFVEGASDARLLAAMAERCGEQTFVGPSQVVPFEFRGVDKIRFLPELVGLFSRMVGADIRWAVLRDGDHCIPMVREAIERERARAGIDSFYQWGRYSIENYLLDPGLLAAAIEHRSGKELGIPEIEALLAEATDVIRPDIEAAYITQNQAAFRRYELDPNPHDAGAREAQQYLRGIDSLERRLSAYPGDRTFGAFVAKLQGRHGVNLRIEDVIRVLSRENAPGELMLLFEKLRTWFPDS